MKKKCAVCNDPEVVEGGNICHDCWMKFEKTTQIKEVFDKDFKLKLVPSNCPSCGCAVNAQAYCDGGKNVLVVSNFCAVCQAQEEAKIQDFLESIQPMLPEIIDEMDEILGDEDYDN